MIKSAEADNLSVTVSVNGSSLGSTFFPMDDWYGPYCIAHSEHQNGPAKEGFRNDSG